MGILHDETSMTLVCDEVEQKADFPKRTFPQTATVCSIVLVDKILLL